MRLLLALTLACVSRAIGARLRARVQVAARDQFAATADDSSQVPNDKIQKVVTMLENLVAEMDAEAAQDEKQLEEFNKWCGDAKKTTQASIESLQAQIEELTASLADLYSQKSALQTEIAKLDGEIAETKQQMAMATEKRTEEHTSFVGEQTDFDNSIAACNKAVELLAAHYGDGTVQQAEKPSWMTESFLQIKATIRSAVDAHNKDGSKAPVGAAFLSDNSPQFDRYSAKTGEALSIVDQMKVLAETFMADKQSAIDEENRLQKLYDTLMAEKTEMLQSLVAQRDERQGVLNQVNQDIAEQETAKANAEAELKDEQAYLSQTTQTCADTNALFEMRKKDRAEEKLAVQEAIKVLEGPAGGAFAQTATLSFLQMKSRTREVTGCTGCKRAAALLSEAAQSLRSSTLATAAAAAMGTDAVKDVVDALKELLTRIDEEQEMENQHKAWCESELSTTRTKKEHHEQQVVELTDKITNEQEVIAEKKQGLIDTAAAIERADHNFQELTRIREEEKQAFDVELQNYIDALAALNQAISILAKFYAEKNKSFIQNDSLLEEGAQEMVAPRKIAPGVFDNVYEKKGGSGVIQMISTVRKEFEQGKADLIKAEDQAIKDYAGAKAAYQQARRELVDQQDRLTVEKQTAEANLAQYQQDKATNEAEVEAAKTYLQQLGQSCDSLLANFDKRVELRNEEKGAINQAINVLENEA